MAPIKGREREGKREPVLGVAVWPRTAIVHRETLRGTEYASGATPSKYSRNPCGDYTDVMNNLVTSDRPTILSQICRNLRFTWHGNTLDVMSLLINKPDGPIKLKFEAVDAWNGTKPPY